jgi:hypothetical protein
LRTDKFRPLNLAARNGRRLNDLTILLFVAELAILLSPAR